MTASDVHALDPRPPRWKRRRRDGRTPNENVHRKPGGFPHPYIALAVLFAVAAAVLLFGALRHNSVLLFLGLAVSVPILIVVLGRSATRRRNRLYPSR